MYICSKHKNYVIYCMLLVLVQQTINKIKVVHTATNWTEKEHSFLSTISNVHILKQHDRW